MTADEAQPYSVTTERDVFCVLDREDRTVLECRDAMSAHHYATLLNKAFKTGFRFGYRAAKTAESAPAPAE